MTNDILGLEASTMLTVREQSVHVPPHTPTPAPKYRIAFAIQKYFEHGGLQRSMRRVAVACAELGHDVHVLTSQWDGPLPANLRIHILPLSARTNHGRSEEFSHLVHQASQSKSFDCLVGYSKMPGLDVYRCGDPCLAERLHRAKGTLLRWLPRYRTYLNLEDGIFGKASNAELLVIAEQEKEHILRHYAAAAPRLHVLPAGIDRQRLQVSAADRNELRSGVRRELGISDADLFLLMVGSSFRTKGVDRSIRAVGSLPEAERGRVRLVVVGEGSVAPMQRLAKRWKLSDRVLFAGTRSDVARLYNAADMLLQPSRLDTGGATILEAMFTGLPVLVTGNCGYAPHVQRAEGGLVCPQPFDQAVLNRQLLQMCAAESRRLWGANARKYCDNTDLYSMVESTVEHILSRAERKRGAA